MTDPRPRTEAELIEQIRSIGVPAPDSLHRQVEAMIAGDKPAAASPRGRSRRGGGEGRVFGFGPRLAAGGAFAAVLIALAIVVGLSGGSSTLDEGVRWSGPPLALP